MLPPSKVCRDAPMLPTMLRDRTTIPRTTPRFLTMRCPGSSKADVTSFGLMVGTVRLWGRYRGIDDHDQPPNLPRALSLRLRDQGKSAVSRLRRRFLVEVLFERPALDRDRARDPGLVGLDAQSGGIDVGVHRNEVLLDRLPPMHGRHAGVNERRVLDEEGTERRRVLAV